MQILEANPRLKTEDSRDALRFAAQKPKSHSRWV